jgi:hypothetical protein
MQSAQRAAKGRNNFVHSDMKQAQREASAKTPDRIDTVCKNDKRQQPTQTKTTINQTPKTPEPEATPGTANSAPTAAQPNMARRL